jgi:hypothetical protein
LLIVDAFKSNLNSITDGGNQHAQSVSSTHRHRATTSNVSSLLAGIDHIFEKSDLPVGMAGFEPATSCSQSRRANQAALHPVALTCGNLTSE